MPNPKAKQNFKIKYRYALNSILIDNELAKKNVDEVQASLTINNNVVHEFKYNIKATIGNHLFKLIDRQYRLSTIEYDHEHSYPAKIALINSCLN